MLTFRLPATLAVLLTGLVLLLATASRQLVHCTSRDGSTRLELQRDAQGCHGPQGCAHHHGAPPAHRDGGHDHDRAGHGPHDHSPDGHAPDGHAPDSHDPDDHGQDDDAGLPVADGGSGCEHLALTIDLANGPRPGLQLPPACAATSPPSLPDFRAPAAGTVRRTPPDTGPPRPPGWLVHRATVVLQL